MNSKIAIALIISLVALLAGCKKADPMVGKWKLQLDASVASKMPKGMTPPVVELEFKDGGAFTASVDLMGQKQSAEGTYKLDGKNLTLTTVTENGKPAKDTAAKTATLSDDMKSFDFPGMNGLGKLVKE